MKDLEINIQELAFLIGWPQERASQYFKDVCKSQDLKYVSKMRLSIETLTLSNKSAVTKLCEKAEDINANYFKMYENRLKMLNDKNCIEKQAWVGKNAAVRVFLKPEDVAKIEANWLQKKTDFYSQQGLFGVTPVLVAKRKVKPSTKEKAVARPN